MTDTAVAGTVRAMACDITVHVPGDGAPECAADVVDPALRVFRAVHRACTRFEADSPLMRANRAPDRWHDVPAVLFDAVREAHGAYVRTRGRFDPRVLTDLVRLGYDRSLGFERGAVATGRADDGRADRGTGGARGPWRPRFRGGPRPQLHLGGSPVDLGGIGKGLALRWAADRLSATTTAPFLLDAGGDCVCRGPGPGGGGWQVGVEHPLDTAAARTGAPDRSDDPDGADATGDSAATDAGGPVAVLSLEDRAVATSSTRLRRWTAGGVAAHHLIDPRTGRPGGGGLAAVTVVADDPARAEVLTKALFLSGARSIGAEARRRSVAALWVGVDGSVSTSGPMDRYVVWRAA